MKLLCAALLLGLALLLPGCGESETATTAVKRFPGHPTTPVPKKLVIEDLKLGSGPEAGRGDQITVRYIGADYKTGKVFIRRWGSDEPLSIRLGFAEISSGWEKGIEGMRIGGERRLVIPHAPRLYEGPVEYVVRLVALKPRPDKQGGV